MMIRSALFVSIAALSLAACKDPAEGTTKATVKDAQPVAAAPAAPAALEALAISSENSKIAFVGSKVTGSHDGGFKSFKGTIHLDPSKFEASRIEVEIDMSSVFTDSDGLTEHLKSGDFFLVSEHPTARFVSTAIDPGGVDGATHSITGNLTLRGVTKEITIPAKIPSTAEGVRATSTFSLPRKLFGIEFAGQPDNLIRDDVVITLDVNAPRIAAK